IHADEPIDQFGDGATRRDYTYIDDIIQGTSAAFKNDGTMLDVFNLGESETIQLKDLIAAIQKALGKKAKINRLPTQPGAMRLTNSCVVRTAFSCSATLLLCGRCQVGDATPAGVSRRSSRRCRSGVGDCLFPDCSDEISERGPARKI